MSELLTKEVEWGRMPVKGFTKKDLINKNSGGLKLVRIMPGCEYPLHRHANKTEYAFVLEGTLQATVGDVVYKGEQGAFYQFPTGEIHGLKNPGDVETIALVGSLKDEE